LSLAASSPQQLLPALGLTLPTKTLATPHLTSGKYKQKGELSTLPNLGKQILLIPALNPKVEQLSQRNQAWGFCHPVSSWQNLCIQEVAYQYILTSTADT
jgi:hypothetical protein